MAANDSPLGLKSVFVFWVPLAATWLMMAVEGTLLAAVIARLAEPKFNLAAHGVAYSTALLVEAPVIMIMSASTALVRDAVSYLRLRRFTYVLNGVLTALMVVLVLPPVFRVFATAVGLDPEVARLTRLALLLLLPWPGAIGYRRFYQGLLIAGGLTRRVAYGTVTRVVAMAVVAVSLALAGLEGARVGAAALSAGVVVEALVGRWMARGVVRSVRAARAEPEAAPSYRSITAFYVPLAMTSLLGMAAHPMVTFFMGQSRMPLESLAVLPVVNSLVFVFRTFGLSFQEVAIALMGPGRRHLPTLRRFAWMLALVASSGLATLAFTPLSRFWFEGLSGLRPDLAAFALTPARILAVMPALTVLLSFQRARLVESRDTQPITWATAAELTVMALMLLIGIHGMGWVGAVAAAWAFVVGRLASVSLAGLALRRSRG